MADLKTLLFKNTLKARKQIEQKTDDMLELYERFRTLYGLIEAADLEAEYYAWQEKMHFKEV